MSKLLCWRSLWIGMESLEVDEPLVITKLENTSDLHRQEPPLRVTCVSCQPLLLLLVIPSQSTELLFPICPVYTDAQPKSEW